MPHEPKRRHSIGRKGKRRASIKLVVAATVNCLNCQAPTLAHKVCKQCGFYKGKAVIVKKENKSKAAAKQANA